MDQLAGGHRPLDGRDEVDELLMAVARHAPAADLTFEDAEGSEQGRSAVALVIVGHGRAVAPLQRQAGLGAIEHLDLALFIDRDYNRMARQVI